ncbi:MAG: hypothetical protein ACREHG_06530, partial [Candidatus Saccharimonadales bacterium]
MSLLTRSHLEEPIFWRMKCIWLKFSLLRRRVRLGLYGVLATLLCACLAWAYYTHQQQMYTLSAATKPLIGSVIGSLSSKLGYSGKDSAFTFNSSGMPTGSHSNPMSANALRKMIGPGTKNTPNLYSARLSKDASNGFTYYDNNLNLSFTLVPEFSVGQGKEVDGRIIYPIKGGGQAVYTFKDNGVQEDIVLNKRKSNDMSFRYKLELPKTLQARTIAGTGDIGIYS